VTSGFEFAGHWIEPGQIALVTPLPGHFDAAHYANPQAFDAARCQPPRNEHLGDSVYSPFGIKAKEHTRHCAAKGFTSVVSIATVASLLSSVELRLPSPDYVPRFVMTPTLSPDPSFSVIVGPRRTPVTPSAVPHAGVTEKITDHLSDDSAKLLTDRLAEAERRHFEPETIVFRQGDPSDGFHVLLEGEVEVLLEEQGAAPKQVATLGPGDYFGEIGLLKNVARTATIRTRPGDAVETVFLDRDTFKELVAETDLFSDELARELHRRYLETHLATAIPELELDDLRRMLAEFTVREYAAGDLIITQGDAPDGFHIICQGDVVVERALPSGAVTKAAELGPGQFFGEIGILQGQPRGASIRAISALVKTMWIGREEFSRLVMQSPGSRNRIARVMHERVMANFDRDDDES
jgi:CRP-like cAMP-binding protein